MSNVAVSFLVPASAPWAHISMGGTLTWTSNQGPEDGLWAGRRGPGKAPPLGKCRTAQRSERAGLIKASFPLLSNFRVKLTPGGCCSGALPQGPEQWSCTRVPGSPGVRLSQWDPQAIALIPWEDEVLPNHFLLEGEQTEVQLTDNSSWDRPAWERDRASSSHRLLNLIYIHPNYNADISISPSLSKVCFKHSQTPDLALWMSMQLTIDPSEFKANPLQEFSCNLSWFWLRHAAYGILVAQPGIRTCSGSLES